MYNPKYIIIKYERSRRKQRRQRRENIARGWVYGGAKSRRVRRY